MIRYIKRKIEEEVRNVKRARQIGITSYSQCGEDLIVRYIFTLRGITKPTYLDIGAHHPLALSNTALFYKTGSRGINVEANPDLIKKFERKRPGDINLNIGIGEAEGKLDFYVMEDNTLSTFSKEEAERMQTLDKKLIKKVQVDVHTLDFVLKKYCKNVFPDFLSIDVEGLDFEILKSIDYSASGPKVICVEAAEYSPKGKGKRRDDLINFVAAQGYIEYANTNLNAILVKNEFWNS